MHKYYILLQIAHIITQLTITSKVVASALKADAMLILALIWEFLWGVLASTKLSNDILENNKKRCQIRRE